MEKIAVHVPTKELWQKVAQEMGSKAVWGSYPYHEKGWGCIVSKASHSSKRYFEEEGYKIISASEYLEGGESVEQEFKVGDEVEVISSEENMGSMSIGTTFVIREVHVSGCKNTWYRHKKYAMGVGAKSLKLINQSTNNKEKTTMADTTIKDVILNHYEKGADAKVVQRYFGSQIADDINGEYLLIDHGTELLKKAKDAEKKYLKDNS